MGSGKRGNLWQRENQQGQETEMDSEGGVEGERAADNQVGNIREKTLAWWRLVGESDSVE